MESYGYIEQNMTGYFNIQPADVNGTANAGVEYYKRMLYTKLYSVFEFTLPKTWKLNFFRFWLFHCGSIGVIYTNKFGWIAQPYSILEKDIYYNPKKIQVYNQFVTSPKVGLIGINSGIINIMDDYFGLDSVITHYAVMLAQCDRSINVNLMNANVTAFFEADNKKQAEELKEAYGKATGGEPFVVVNKDVMNGKKVTTLLNAAKENLIIGDLLAARRDIMNAFLTEIGIKNANTQKKERLVVDEVNQNNDETKAIITVIFENIKRCMSEINDISGLGLDVKLRYEESEAIDNE